MSMVELVLKKKTMLDLKSIGAIVLMAMRESTARTRPTTASSCALSARTVAPVSQTSPLSTLSVCASQDSKGKSAKKRLTNVFPIHVCMGAIVSTWSTDSAVSVMGRATQGTRVPRTSTSVWPTLASMEVGATTLSDPSLVFARALLRVSVGRDAM